MWRISTASPLCHFLGAFGPCPNPRSDSAQPLSECGGNDGIVGVDVDQDLVEIGQRLVGIDDPHGRRLESAASTSSSFANRPSRAALSPRSIPASSSWLA